MLAVARFVRDTGHRGDGHRIRRRGLSEGSTGETAIDAEPFDILGTLADRLARRASGASKAQEALLSTRVDTARHYGIRFIDIERDGRVRLCYDRRSIPSGTGAVEAGCPARPRSTRDHPQRLIDPTLLPSKRQAVDQWRAEVLDQVDINKLPEYLKKSYPRAASLGLGQSGVPMRQNRHGNSRRHCDERRSARALDALAVRSTRRS